jgi:hypothetical protein
MDNRLFICAAIIFLTALLGILAYNNLEIYSEITREFPSREVIANYYTALERWLKQTGHRVRIENNFQPDKLADIKEKVVMLNSRMYGWYSTERITHWIKQGGHLILSLDLYNNTLDNNLLEFLSGFGIETKYSHSIYTETVFTDSESQVDFSTRIAFIINDDNIFYIKDGDGIIRLAEVPIGSGSIIVFGIPVFMYNYYLQKEANAVLTWQLTGARTDENNKGILFYRIHNRHASNSIFGAIIERGNLIPVIISAFILIFIGFWMVIPGFGLVFEEKQRMARPLKDRFNAEIRFLKKYHALNHYMEMLDRRHKTSENTDKEKIYNYRELINQYRSIFNETGKF